MRRVRSARPSAEHLRQGNAWPCPFLPKRSFWTGTWRSTQRELPLAQPPKTHHNIRTRWRLDLFINLREDEPGYEREFSHLFLLRYVEWLTDSDVRDIRGINPTLYWIHLSSPLMFYQVQAEAQLDEPRRNSIQSGEASPSQTSASSPSAFQAIANAFRRTFSGTNQLSSSNTAVIMYKILGS